MDRRAARGAELGPGREQLAHAFLRGEEADEHEEAALGGEAELGAGGGLVARVEEGAIDAVGEQDGALGGAPRSTRRSPWRG